MSSVFTETFTALRGLDYEDGIVYLFSLNEGSVVKTPTGTTSTSNDGATPLGEFYTLRREKNLLGVDSQVLYAGATPLEIYLVGAEYFIKNAASNDLTRVGKIGESSGIIEM